MLFALLTSASMDVDALNAAYALKFGDVTAVRERLNIDQADPLAGIIRILREDCGVDSWHQLLSTHLECVLAWSPDQIEEFIQGINGLGNVYEVLADGLVKVTSAVEAKFGRDRAIENHEFNTWKRAELKKKREGAITKLQSMFRGKKGRAEAKAKKEAELERRRKEAEEARRKAEEAARKAQDIAMGAAQASGDVANKFSRALNRLR